MYCQWCDETSKGSDRIDAWWGFNGGYLCKKCKKKYLAKDSDKIEEPEKEIRRRIILD